MRGQNQIKAQKLDISLYSKNDSTSKPIILKDIIVCDYNELTTVDLSRH